MSRRSVVTAEQQRALVLRLVRLSVVLALWAAVLLRLPEPVPCVHYSPANAGCAADSPAVQNRR